MSSYDSTHTSDACDKCLENVGRDNLEPVNFIYLDRNDHVHPNIGDINPVYKDYHQYYICKNCKEIGKRRGTRKDVIEEDVEEEIIVKRIKR